ncbi:MAG: hypothetical protein ACE362_02300 [Phaeodactylibacter xiamenensis]|uniref:hypothetical protein n=1 Tax=Phaeodactylibacter xiamenensis TaxID=1524460 RepID=UPI0006987E8C|nr:hypothetical protein [Phaeodactylibacter xiamenensis]MCR9053527.1 hypothetical protein [bacterium]
MGLRIDINEVEKALQNLLAELRKQKGDVIEMEPVDYYWSIDRDELYNPYNDPTHLTLGQLTDDLEEIKKLADSGAAPVAQDLVKISSVLAALGHKTVW